MFAARSATLIFLLAVGVGFDGWATVDGSRLFINSWVDVVICLDTLVFA